MYSSRVSQNPDLQAQVMIQKPTQRAIYSKPAQNPTSGIPVRPPGPEKDAISQMFKQQAAHWEQTQDQMATVRPVFRPSGRTGTGYRTPVHFMDMDQRPPPPGYTCFRCGERGLSFYNVGHYINVCPTLGDPDFENKPKIKKATG